MTRTDRRNALRLAMAAAMAPAVCASRGAAAAPDRLIAPPAMPMRYSRTVTRELADGRPFSVTRQFEIDFQPFANGFMLHGEQRDVVVDAPESLSEFIRIERERDESGIFPIALDPFGLILSSQIARPVAQDLHHAVSAALADLASQPISSDEREQLSQFITTLQRAGQRVTAHLPTDLFAPADERRRDERNIGLPGGIEGSVETLFESQRDQGTGLMRAATRAVITRVADSSRGTHESWSLTPL